MIHRLWLVALLLASGCNVLFPEFFGGKPLDAGVADHGVDAAEESGAPHLSGVACVLADLRDYRSCAVGNPGALRLTVEETREMAMTDSSGRFRFPLSQALATATLLVVDPHGQFAASVVPLRLDAGVADELALPLAPAAAVQQIALGNGATLDPARAALLVWAVDARGTPVAGATVSGAGRPLYDDAGANQLSPGVGTAAHGAAAAFDLLPTKVAVTVTPTASPTLRPDQFTLPLRAGALTLTTLPLPPR
jgi:hypothetical protein